MKHHFWTLLALLVFCAAEASALPAPWYGVTVDGGSTSNLFADSIAVADQYGSLGLTLEQSIASPLLLYYDGNGQLYANNGSLGNQRHEAGFEAGSYLGRRGEVWLTGGAFTQLYGGDFALYNRQGWNSAGGVRWLISPALRFRSGAGYTRIDYPKADTLSVGYNEARISAGLNIALPIPLALDIEPAYQVRHYTQLDPEAVARALVVALRISGPYNDVTGLSLNLMLRNQFDMEGGQVVALFNGGINPGDLLWSGWRLGPAITRLMGPWKTTVSGEVGQAHFLEVSALTGRDPRDDTSWRVNATFSRFLFAGEHGPVVTAGLNLGYVDNRSNDGFYTYSAFSASLTLNLRARD